MIAWVCAGLVLLGIAGLCFACAIFGLVRLADERLAALRPVGGSGRRRISHMLKEGFSVGRIARELQVSRGLVLAVRVQMETEVLAHGHKKKGKR